jgi:hypothetical protein
MIAFRTTSRRVAAAFAAAATLGMLSVASAAVQGVEWTNQVNVAQRGNGLQKIGGCDGCDDAGAMSRQTIRGDGYVEFTVGEPYTFWVAGLSRSGSAVRFNDIDYALRFNANGSADVLENGQYQGGDIDYAPGDRFRIAIDGGRVDYLKNGRVIFESRRAPQYPLVLETVFGSTGASIRDALIETTARAWTSNDDYRESDRYGESDRYRRGAPGYRNGGAGTSGQFVTVSSLERWTDTGIWVNAGDTLTFDAEGRIQMSADPNDVATPAGARSGRLAPAAPMRNRAAGMLIGRIGDSGVMQIGDRRRLRAPMSGELLLGVNDDALQDNSGEYRVSIAVEP